MAAKLFWSNLSQLIRTERVICWLYDAQDAKAADAGEAIKGPTIRLLFRYNPASLFGLELHTSWTKTLREILSFCRFAAKLKTGLGSPKTIRFHDESKVSLDVALVELNTSEATAHKILRREDDKPIFLLYVEDSADYSSDVSVPDADADEPKPAMEWSRNLDYLSEDVPLKLGWIPVHVVNKFTGNPIAYLQATGTATVGNVIYTGQAAEHFWGWPMD